MKMAEQVKKIFEERISNLNYGVIKETNLKIYDIINEIEFNELELYLFCDIKYRKFEEFIKEKNLQIQTVLNSDSRFYLNYNNILNCLSYNYKGRELAKEETKNRIEEDFLNFLNCEYEDIDMQYDDIDDLTEKINDFFEGVQYIIEGYEYINNFKKNQVEIYKTFLAEEL